MIAMFEFRSGGLSPVIPKGGDVSTIYAAGNF
jgi:hypothetical protein